MIGVPVTESSQVSEARREAVAIADKAGFSEAERGRVALVVTELATNLIKHGDGGEILAGLYDDDTGHGIEVLAIDQGRGMDDVGRAMSDGYSSVGTRGEGLGAVARQATTLDIASWQDVGTAVLARITPGRGPQAERVQPWFGAVSVPMPGQEVCGDSFSIARESTGAVLMVADGLGHGPEAAEASVEAVRLFQRYKSHQIAAVLDDIHHGLRATRGAAVSAARYDPASGNVVFGGIGNVAGVLVARGNMRRMVTSPGTAGFNARKIQSFDYPFTGGLLILLSDGLSTSWALARYPGIEACHPTLVAAVLYRDFGRHRDDATVLVGKWPIA